MLRPFLRRYRPREYGTDHRIEPRLAIEIVDDDAHQGFVQAIGYQAPARMEPRGGDTFIHGDTR